MIVTFQGAEVAATVPGGIIKLVDADIPVEPDLTTIVTLDFDADHSLVLKPGEDIIFKPTVKLLVRQVPSPAPQKTVAANAETSQVTTSAMEVRVTDTSVAPVLIASASQWGLLSMAALLVFAVTWRLRRAAHSRQP